MKCVIAPDSFKECLSSVEVASIISEAFLSVDPSIVTTLIPMADGGEGTLEVLVEATGGQLHKQAIRGPLGEAAVGYWGVLGDGSTAVIEMAKAAGLEMVPPNKRDPMHTSSLGVGQLILSAIESGCKRCYVTLGGSATVDGGLGMLQALGAEILDSEGRPVPSGGKGLSRVSSVNSKPLKAILDTCEFVGICDVENPLLGEKGAAPVFGPQKGACSQMVEDLTRGLSHWAQFSPGDLAHAPRTGAAGGLGFALAAYLDAPLRSGLEVTAETLELAKHLEGANLVITGEGEINGQSVNGKVPCGVAEYAKRHGIPVIAIAGNLGKDHLRVLEAGVDAVFSLTPGPVTLEKSLKNARQYLFETCVQIAKTLKIGSQL